MQVLLALSIVAVVPEAPIDVRYPAAEERFHCVFDRSWDRNYDDWPDGWRRRRGPDFPHYVNIAIRGEPSPVGDRCLRVDLDGGGAAVVSPLVRASPLFSYVLEARLKTEGLQHDRAFVSVSFLDHEQRVLESVPSAELRFTHEWQKIRLGPIAPRSRHACYAMIGLHVEPNGEQDLTGSAWFDDLWLGCVPRMSLATGSPHNVFTDPGQVRIECRVSGFVDKTPVLVFLLEDEAGNELARHPQPIQAKRPGGADLSLDAGHEPSLVGSTTWTPPVAGPGFYRVRVIMKSQAVVVQQHDLTLAVIRPQSPLPHGIFGWTLPAGDRPLPLSELEWLLGQMGLSWAKFPLWCYEWDDDYRISQLMTFRERLAERGIELVGMLDRPPEKLAHHFDRSGDGGVAEVFAAGPEVWYPYLEPVLMRLATQVRWWQLGGDNDTSFIAYPNLPARIAQVKTEMDKMGQDAHLGLGWDWIHELPREPAPPWRFLSLSADPPLTGRELRSYLASPGREGVQTWIVLRPLDRRRYSMEVRVADLVARMMAAVQSEADAAFIPDPYDPNWGLFRGDGTPDELLLPWRTTAQLLAGAKYLGSIQLPKGSHNRVFIRGDEVVMVVWNEKPVREVIYCGDRVRQIDLWGRVRTLQTEGRRQVIEVSRLPTFVTGVSEPITRWRMDFAIERSQIPSVFGVRHENAFRLKNAFPRSAGGYVTLVTPELWSVRPQRFSFKLAEGEAAEHAFDINLPFNAASGRQKIRVDFEVEADQVYRFSAFRNIDVGLGDVFIEFITRLNDRGELEVQQRFENQTDRTASFRCELFAPERERKKTNVVELGRGSDVQVYYLPNGRELIGKTLWLRAEELNGPRILNYRFQAEE